MGRAILCLDDDEDIVKSLKRELRYLRCEILTATTGEEALKLMIDHECAVVISDMRMPEMDGAEFFRRVLEIESYTVQSHTFRILLTGFSDFKAAIAAVNTGEIHRYLQKPWAADQLRLAVEQGLDRFDLVKENIALTDELAERNEALAELNATLEQRVEDRTRQLLHSAKLSAVGQLAAGLVHEVATPLTVAIGWVELMQQDERILADHQESLEMASEGLSRTTAVLDKLLDLSRVKPHAKQAVDLNSLLKHTLELLSHRFRWEQVDLRKDLVDIGRIWADQGQLEQVFLNLVNNALDAMPAGGLLSVRTRKLLTQGRDKVVEVDIVDTGQGIPEDQLARVFEPFFSTKGDGGTGLGLPISLGVIEEHGGNIAIDSEVGVGTTFRVRIPVGNPSV